MGLIPCRDFPNPKMEGVGLKRRRRRRRRRGDRERLSMAVHRKVQRLEQLVPGAEGLNQDEVLLETAHYILRLRLQASVLQALLLQFHEP